MPLLGLLVSFPGVEARGGGRVLDLLVGDRLGDDVLEEFEVVVVVDCGCWRMWSVLLVAVFPFCFLYTTS